MAPIPTPLSLLFDKHKFLDTDGVWKVRREDLLEEITAERDETRKRFFNLFGL